MKAPVGGGCDGLAIKKCAEGLRCAPDITFLMSELDEVSVGNIRSDLGEQARG